MTRFKTSAITSTHVGGPDKEAAASVIAEAKQGMKGMKMQKGRAMLKKPLKTAGKIAQKVDRKTSKEYRKVTRKTKTADIKDSKQETKNKPKEAYCGGGKAKTGGLMYQAGGSVSNESVKAIGERRKRFEKIGKKLDKKTSKTAAALKPKVSGYAEKADKKKDKKNTPQSRLISRKMQKGDEMGGKSGGAEFEKMKARRKAEAAKEQAARMKRNDSLANAHVNSKSYQDRMKRMMKNGKPVDKKKKQAGGTITKAGSALPAKAAVGKSSGPWGVATARVGAKARARTKRPSTKIDTITKKRSKVTSKQMGGNLPNQPKPAGPIKQANDINGKPAFEAHGYATTSKNAKQAAKMFRTGGRFYFNGKLF